MADLIRKKGWAFAPVLLLCALLGACEHEDYSQKPSDHFVEGVFPESLESFANPIPTGRVAQSIIKRVERDQTRRDLLTVAVIDSGADYMHPALSKKLAFEVNGGQIVGAGLDIQGADPWAHPHLVDPSLFAFGAEKITRDGRISGAQTDPLAFYQQLNERFMADFVAAIKKHPVLSKSLYSKITEDAMTITGVRAVLEHVRAFPKSEYERNQKAGRLFDWNLRTNPRLSREEDAFQQMAADVLDKKWKFGEDFGLPAAFGSESTFISNFGIVEHSEEFFLLLKDFYKKNPHAQTFEKAFQNYVKFKDLRRLDEDLGDTKHRELCLSGLHRAHQTVASYYDNHNPLVAFLENMRSRLSYAEQQELEQTPKAERVSRGQELFNEYFLNAQAALEFALNAEVVDREDLLLLRKQLKHLEQLRGLADAVMTPEAYEFLVTGQIEALKSMRVAFSKWARNLFHPYVSENSSSFSHGTHTAATVLAQDQGDSLRVYPIRVVTSDVKEQVSKSEQRFAQFLKDFQQWLERPEVLDAVYGELDAAGLVEEHKSLKKVTLKHKREAVDQLWPEFEETFFTDQPHQRLEYDFFDQIVESIKHVGEKQLKVVSMSLGVGHEEGVDEGEDEERESRVQRIARFMHAEYFKFKLAENIKQYAPQTLFFIATGNDSRWLDSHSQSGMPADLSSPWLEKYRQAHHPVAPNNQLDNIVAVLSLNKDQRLSSFTNLPISESTAIVGANGEAVRAAVNLTDISAAFERLEKEVPEPVMAEVTVEPESEEFWDFAEQMGWINPKELKTDEQKKHALDLASGKFSYFMGSFLGGAFEAVLSSRSMQNQHADALMSGTSMATPNMAGYAATLIVEKMKRLGLSEKEIWDHPEFRPQVLIQELQAKLDAFGGKSLLRDLPVLRQAQTYKQVITKKPCQLRLI